MFFSALKHRNYKVYFLGISISSTGNWANRVAQDWLVLELTGSAKALGAIVACQFIPGLLFSAYAGSLADRFDHRKALILINALDAFTGLGLGLLVLTHHINILIVAIGAFLIGTTGTLDGPIRQTFYLVLVGDRDLPNALSLNSANINLGRLIGPAISGVLIDHFGTGPSFLVNSFSYVITIISLMTIRPNLYVHQLNPIPRKGETSVAENSGNGILQGFRYFFSNRYLLTSVMVVSLFAMWGQDFQITSALMAKQTFARSASSFGFLGTSYAAGAIIGSLILARKTKPLTIHLILFRAGFMTGAWLLASLAPTFYWFAATLFLCGYFAAGMNISTNAGIRTFTLSEFYGRSWGIYILIYQTLIAIGALILGAISDAYSPRHSIIAGAFFALFTVLWATRRVGLATKS
jgi:MFS family permease